MATPQPPDALIAMLLDAPEGARDVLTTVLAKATALAEQADPPQVRLAVLTTWVAYQAQLAVDMSQHPDAHTTWLQHMAWAATVLAGDQLAELLP